MKLSLKQMGFIVICLYFISLGIPIRPDIPMIMLSAAGMLLTLASFNVNKNENSISSIVFTLVLFLVSMLLSFFVSIDIKRSLLLSLSFIPGCLIFVLLIEMLDNNKIYQIYLVFSILGILISFDALKTAIAFKQEIPTVWIKNMKNSNILVPNDLILLTILIPFSLSLIISETSPVYKLISILSIILNICTITIYQSRGALILAGVSFIGMMYFSKSHKMLIFCIITIALALMADLISGAHLISKFKGIWNTRIVYWLIAWKMFKDAPILGHGSHTYASVANEYRNQIKIPEWVSIDERFAPWVHNLYLEVLSEQGSIGLLCFALLICCAFKTVWKTLKMSDKKISILGAGTLMSLLNFSLAACFELTFVRRWVVMMFFSLLGIIVFLSYQSSMEKGNEK